MQEALPINYSLVCVLKGTTRREFKTYDKSLLVHKGAMLKVLARLLLIKKKKLFLKIKAQMIKENFLHSEPNLCFGGVDATAKKNILKNILYNITCMTET